MKSACVRSPSREARRDIVDVGSSRFGFAEPTELMLTKVDAESPKWTCQLWNGLSWRGEHAKHGFCRRLETLVRSIDRVYELLPPDQAAIPKRDIVVDAAIAIQAFTMNAFGCLENIAWIWVYEKDVKNSDGTDLHPTDVGLWKKRVRRALTKEFRDYLDKKETWLANLTSFRDSLAHRIPLYIPPYVVPKPNVEKYNALEKAKWEEPAKSDPLEYEKVKAAQLELCQFVPGMMHSIFEDSPHVEFHSQLLNDYVTIDEYGLTLLEELDRQA